MVLSSLYFFSVFTSSAISIVVIANCLIFSPCFCRKIESIQSQFERSQHSTEPLRKVEGFFEKLSQYTGNFLFYNFSPL